MNAQEVLKLLVWDADKATVDVAIDWFKTKKPTNKSAIPVFQKLFIYPKFQQDFELVTNWIQQDIEIILNEVARIYHPELFDWLVDYIETNPSHPAVGKFWAELLFWCRDSRLEKDALDWLKLSHNNDNDNKVRNEIIAELLRIATNEDSLKFAKQELGERFDISLLESIIRYTDDAESTALGVSIIKTAKNQEEKKIIATALVDQNISANEGTIKLFLSDSNSEQSAREFLYEICVYAEAEVLAFACNWLVENRNSAIAKWFLRKEFPHNSLIAYNLWLWFTSGEDEDSRFEIFIRILSNSECTLQDETADLVSSWIEKNPRHKLEKYAAKALTRERIPQKKTSDGRAINFYPREEFIGHVNARIEEYEESAQKILKSQMAKSPAYTEPFLWFSVSIFLTKSLEEAQADCVSKTDEGIKKARFMLEALPDNDFEFILFETLDILMTKRLHQRKHPDWKCTGIFITKLLKRTSNSSQPNSSITKLLEHAENWLKIRPTKDETRVFNELAALVKSIRSA